MRVEEDSASTLTAPLLGQRLAAMMCVIRLKRVAGLIFHGAPSFHGIRTPGLHTFLCLGGKDGVTSPLLSPLRTRYGTALVVSQRRIPARRTL